MQSEECEDIFSVNFKKITKLPIHQPGLVIKPQAEGMLEARFLPLTSIDVRVDIEDTIAIVTLSQEFFNPGEGDEPIDPQADPSDANGNPIETLYKFPKDPKSVISKMKVVVGSKVIEAKVMEKAKA